MYSTIHQFIIVFISAFSLFVAFWVYFSNRKSKVNRLFFWIGIAIFFWVILCYLGNNLTNPKLALFLGKLAYGETALFFIPLYFFFIHFFREEKKFIAVNIFVLISSIFLFFFSVFTNLMIKGVEFTEFGAMPVYGKWKFVYFGLVGFIAVFIVSRILINYFKFQEKEKLRIQYFLVGVFPWFFLNFIFNILFPLFQKIPRYFYLGNYSAIFLLAFTAYAIVKRRLFGIKVVLTDMLVGLMGIILLILPFFMPTRGLRVLTSSIFLLFLVFSHYLVRAIHSEEKRRKIAERLARKERKQRKEARHLIEEFKDLDDAKNQFIIATQHHLRTPLTAIIGYLDLINTGSYGKVPKNIKGPLSEIKTSADRLSKVIDELLDVSQFQLGKKIVSLEPGVRIEPILEEIIKDVSVEAKSKGIYLKFQHPKVLPSIKADSLKLKVALTNIIDNAIKYTDKGGVTVKVKAEDSKILISVKDTGIGLSKEDKKKLFIRSFTRGQQARRLYATGKGLGLFISRKIIEAHHGKIWAESKGENKGSTFYIELPR